VGNPTQIERLGSELEAATGSLPPAAFRVSA